MKKFKLIFKSFKPITFNADTDWRRIFGALLVLLVLVMGFGGYVLWTVLTEAAFQSADSTPVSTLQNIPNISAISSIKKTYDDKAARSANAGVLSSSVVDPSL